MIWTRFITVSVMLAGTASMLFMRSAVDQVPDSVPLELLPHTLDDRHAMDIPIDAGTLELLGHGRFLNRVYTTPDRTSAAEVTSTAQPLVPISLFIGYFPTQRTGQAIHSPQNCLPGAGWTFESSGITTIADAGGKQYRVGEYIITDGTQKQEVLYWYRAHGRSIASDYQAKLYMLVDAIRYNRTDGALVRVITPLVQGETERTAHARATHFAGELASLLPAYIPD